MHTDEFEPTTHTVQSQKEIKEEKDKKRAVTKKKRFEAY